MVFSQLNIFVKLLAEILTGRFDVEYGKVANYTKTKYRSSFYEHQLVYKGNQKKYIG